MLSRKVREVANCFLGIVLALVWLLFASVADADDAIFSSLISQYETTCDLEAQFEISDEGTYTVQFGANNATTAYIVSPLTLTCNNQDVGLCGSRGCPLKVFVEGQTYDMLGWHVSSMQVELQSLLVVQQSGKACNFDFPNSEHCYALWEWDVEQQRLKFLR